MIADADITTTTMTQEIECFSSSHCLRCDHQIDDDEHYCPACKRIIRELNREEFFAYIAITARAVSMPVAEQRCHAPRIGRMPDFPSGEV